MESMPSGYVAVRWPEVGPSPGAGHTRRVTAADPDRRIAEQLERGILDLLAQRADGATICPSEAARLVGSTDEAVDAWRDLMEPARRAAARLVASGDVEVTQGGEVVDPGTARGPIRIRRARPS
jgi:hypothetical protein